MSANVEEVQQLAVSLTLEAKSFEKQMTAINQVINNAEKSFKLAGKGVENYENTFVGLNAKIEKSEKQVAIYQKKLELQREEFEKTEKTVKTNKDKLEQLSKTVGENSKEYIEWSNKVQEGENKLKKLSVGILDSEKNIELLSKDVETSKKKFEELGNRVKTTGEQLEEIDRQALLTQSEMDKLGSELEESGHFFQKLGLQITETANKMETGIKKVEILEAEVKQLSSTLEMNEQQHKEVAGQIDATSSSLKEAEQKYGSNSSEAQDLKHKLLALKDQYQTLETEIDQNKKALDGYQTELNQTQTEVQELSRELKNIPFEEISQGMKTSGENIKNVGQLLSIGVSVPLLGIGAAAVSTGKNFDTSMSKLQATAGIADKTSDSFVALENKAKELGSTTSFSASDAADGLTYLALAGWDVETSMDRIEPVLRAAEAGNMDLATASDLVTDSMSAANIEGQDFTKYLDITAQAQRRSNQSMQEMLEAYKGAGGIFNQLNMPLEESGALLGVLANRGKKGSEAANGLISVFSNLITETGQAGKALDQLDISLYDSQGKQRNMIEVLKEMAGKLGVTADGTSNLTEQQQQQYAAMVGGKTQFDTLMAALSGVSGEYDELYDALVNSDGALNEVATTMKDNLGGEIESMSSALEGALIEAFKSLEPVLSTCIGYITDAARWFTSLDEEQQKNIVTLGITAAAIGPLMAGIGQLIIVGGNAVTLFGKFKSGALGASGATGGLTNALGIFAGPVGVGVAVAALIALMTYVGDNENMILSLQEKFGGLGTIVGGVCEFVSGIVQLTIGRTISWVQLGMDVIAAIIDGPGGATIQDAWTDHWSRLENHTTEGMQKITLTTTRGMSQMRNSTDESLNAMLGTFQTVLDQVPVITDENYGEAAGVMSQQLSGMDNNQLTILRGMNDTAGYLFKGIREGMTIEASSKQVEENLKAMAQAGKLDSETFSNDIQSAIKTMSEQLVTETQSSSETASTNMETMNTDVVESMEQMNTDSKSSVNEMKEETIKSSGEMASQAITSANKMNSEVGNATNNMANRAIGDWNRIRSAYSKPITGTVKVTTYSSGYSTGGTSPSSYALESPIATFSEDLRARTPIVDMAKYQLSSEYYSPPSSKTGARATDSTKSELKDIKKILNTILDGLQTSEDKTYVLENIINFGGREFLRVVTEGVIKEISRQQRSQILTTRG